MHPIAPLQAIGQCNDVEWILAAYVLHNSAKHGYEHHDAVNKIETLLKTRSQAGPASKFDVEHKGAPTMM